MRGSGRSAAGRVDGGDIEGRAGFFQDGVPEDDGRTNGHADGPPRERKPYDETIGELYASLMAEPFLLRPWEIGELTDGQIRMMIAGQKRVTESIAKQTGRSVPENDVDDDNDSPVSGGSGSVTESEAAEFFKSVDRIIYGE